MKILGLMSGTSADGLDMALCDITGAPPTLNATILAGETVAYPPELREAILRACDATGAHTPHLSDVNWRLGQFCGEESRRFLQAHDQSADLIASHGQTVWHAVDATGAVTSTLQLGASAVIAEATGVTVISDFRSRDIAAGGQGAPLTAYVDWLLLRHPTRWRAVQNIGGIGNVSLLPPLCEESASLLAFDTGAGNVLMDTAVSTLTEGKQTYDHNGTRAAAGIVDEALLDTWLAHPYYHRPPPKTTGRELFTAALVRKYITAAHERGLSTEDTLATLTALTAHSIAHAYEIWLPQMPDEVIVGGGGSRNPTLMHYLRALLAPVDVHTHEAISMDSDLKEALVFAVLAYETWHGRTATLPSQTGAHHARVLGSITPGDNYRRLLQQTLSQMKAES